MKLFFRNSEPVHVTNLPGIAVRALANGAETLLAEYHLEKGKEVPAHAHPETQTGYLVRGRLNLRIGAERLIVEKGDSWLVPSGVEHGADILEDSVAIEVFTPPRKELLG